ncbi:MAG: tripartite tricarboxylate transporter substrate-binding protein [Rubritepida sp.]|nr:tripartite tricarboxylate transporter substrate-binding protein [Rubritepida sp.]
MRLPRRPFLALPAVLAAPRRGNAADWRPRGPVTIILPIAPGGASDAMFRTLQGGFQAATGQPLVIDYRPGGGTVIGTEMAARAAPDGHTLGLAANSTLINQVLHGPRLPYRVFQDFAPVARLGIVPHVLVCHPSLAEDFAGFLRVARARPGGISFASYGQGTSNHLGFEQFRLLAGFEATHVPYRGGPPAYTDLVAGRVDAMFMNLPGVFRQVEAGAMRALAVAAPAPVPRVAAPTLASLGYGEVLSNTWTGVVAPAGTPAPALAALEAAFLGLVRDPATAARLNEIGFTVLAEGSAEFAAGMRRDFAVYEEVVRRAGITLA